MGIEVLMLPQENKKGMMQGKGCNREAAMLRGKPTDEAEKKTTARRVVTAQNPRRHSLIQSQKPNIALRTTPMTMKDSHKIQQNSESATVLRITKMGSCFNTK